MKQAQKDYVKVNEKIMLTVLFSFQAVMHYEVLSAGQIVNRKYYFSVFAVYMRKLDTNGIT